MKFTDKLERDLRDCVSGEVRFSAGDRALYATDASNYRQVPIGVVIPRSIDDIVSAIEVCHGHGAPVLGRGGGTSIAGQCCNTAVVIDTSKYLNRVLDIDPAQRTARVEPGVVLDHFRAATATHGLSFGPDPGTHRNCTLGGMIGNNSCGVHSVQSQFYGPGPTTADNVDTLDVLTYRGGRLHVGPTTDSEYRRRVDEGGATADLFRQLKAFQERYAPMIRREFPDIPRRVSGYNLPALLPEHGFNVARALVGSESTLVFVLEASVHLVQHFSHRVLVVLGYPDIFDAADAVPPLLEYRPIGLEGVDEMLVREGLHSGIRQDAVRLLPSGRGWLLVEFGGETAAAARDAAEPLLQSLPRTGWPEVRVFDDPRDQARIWEIREMGAPSVPATRDQAAMWPGWDDSAVSPEKVGAYLRDLHALYAKYEYQADLFGHFGQGCVHCRVGFDLQTRDGIANFRSFMYDAADLVHRYGGSLSGEHGDGQARGELLTRMFSNEMVQAFREFKAIWDPDSKMNPGKVVDAAPLDANLRLDPSEHIPVTVHTHFKFPEERGSFQSAAMRCVGVGKCRQDQAGTMCPSYMVTREEKHATRGRARLLFEMLRGDPVTGGWDSDEVHEALDLCLSCKGCKGDCPVQVDMATYKAEFLSHYYEHHRRPRTAYAFGLINVWAQLASFAPRLVNMFTQTPGLSVFAKAAAGLPQERRIPAFAPETFRNWFARRSAPPVDGRPRVILWTDTFNNHFHPETAIAAVDVLEDAGFAVDIPRTHICCGRPLYDYGMLTAARKRLTRILDTFERDDDPRVPIVGLEPSCVAVFKDELPNLMADDPRARPFSQRVCSFGEFLERHKERVPALTLQRPALVHGHCHQKALHAWDADVSMLKRLGLDATPIDSGCCGMAGSFGFERDHYAVSQAVGERRLLPAVRAAQKHALIVADGFSCREQIAQATDRRAVHLAEAFALARRAPHAVPLEYPEACQVIDHSRARLTPAAIAWVAVGLAVAAFAVGWAVQRERTSVSPLLPVQPFLP